MGRIATVAKVAALGAGTVVGGWALGAGVARAGRGAGLSSQHSVDVAVGATLGAAAYTVHKSEAWWNSHLWRKLWSVDSAERISMMLAPDNRPLTAAMIALTGATLATAGALWGSGTLADGAR